MNIINYVKNTFKGISSGDDMVRYYRSEYGREWRQCRQLFPHASEHDIMNSCFKGRTNR